MSIDLLISKLDKVRKTGPNTWRACCPAHGSCGQTLSIKDDDGKILLRCFAECSVPEIVAAVGMEVSDLFPPKESSGRPEKRPFPTSDALRAVAFEALVVVAAAKRITSKQPLPESDYERLLKAAERINAALSATGIERGRPWTT